MGLLTLNDLSGLGQSECGSQPATGPGELIQCCPGVGWVIYDQYTSSYGLCERAKAQAGFTDDAEGGAVSDDLEARRAELEARRMELEDRQFQQQVQMIMLQAALKRQIAAQQAANAPIEAERRRKAAEAAAAAEARKREQQKKLLGWGAAALVAAKLLLF